MKVKNSNKVLLLILSLTIAIPLLVAMVLRHKVNTGQFVLINRDIKADPALSTPLSFEGITSVKITGPQKNLMGSGVFGINLMHDNHKGFMLKREELSDSIAITRRGDTLEFAYYRDTAEHSDLPGSYDHRQAILNLPDTVAVYAENCLIRWPVLSQQLRGQDSQNSHNNQDDSANPGSGSLHLTKGAILELGNTITEYRKNLDTTDMEFKTLFVLDSTGANRIKFDTTFMPIGSLRIFAGSSTVRFIQPLEFTQLHLELDQYSSLKISYPFHAKKVSGKLDDRSNIKGTWQSLRPFQALILNKKK